MKVLEVNSLVYSQRSLAYCGVWNLKINGSHIFCFIFHHLETVVKTPVGGVFEYSSKPSFSLLTTSLNRPKFD
jgi:hypothetical protein